MQQWQQLLGNAYLNFLVSLILLSCSSPTRAQELLSTMTVTAPRPPLNHWINNPQLLTAEDIGIAHERSITDVVQGFSSISSSKAGAFGQASSLYIRGAGGQGVVTLDGIPLLQSLPGLFSLDTLPAEAIQSATIIKGPDAADLPFQSLGGGVHLSTQDQQTTGGKLSAEGGSFGILRETLQAGVANQLGRVTATLSRTDAFDGMHVADSAQNPERDPLHFTQGIMRFAADLSQRLKWQGTLLYRNAGISIDDYNLDSQRQVVAVDDTHAQAHEETWLAQNRLDAQLTAAWHSQLQLGYTQTRTTSAFSSGLTNTVLSRLYLLNWHNQHTLIDNPQGLHWQVNWGAQGRHEQGESTTSVFAQQRTMVASFLQTQARYGNLSGEAGVRVEQFDQYGDHPLFKSAVAWRITQDLTLRASGGTGYRLPSYNELLFLFFANKDLKPERSASGELAVEWYPSKDANISVKGFYHRYDDLITIAHESFRGPITLNVPDAAVAGMEIDTRLSWTNTLESGISYTFSDSRDLNTDRALPYRPTHIGRVWGQQKLQAWPITLWAETVVRSSTWNDFANTLPVGASVQLNAAIRYTFSKHVEAYIRGENLTNNQTPQVYSANAAGAAVYVGFTVGF